MVGKALIDGEIAFRQHRGGHTTGPNWPTFLAFADRYIKGPARGGWVERRSVMRSSAASHSVRRRNSSGWQRPLRQSRTVPRRTSRRSDAEAR